MTPVDSVTRFLRLVEERRLDEAAHYLAPGVEIVFPGGRRFTDLDEQVAASQGRYRSIRKVFERFDVVDSGDGTVVYVSGLLDGEDLAGRPFSSVRFIDRFELLDGLIVKHHVWNDLAEQLRQPND